MKVLVVDDERPAREELIWLLEQCDQVEVVGQAPSAETAFETLDDRDVDLLFLDIDMPGIGGMRLAETLRDDAPNAPAVVFVTAYDNHAVEAFGVDAVDYLLKPVRLERLQRALDKVRKRTTALSEASERQARPLNRISVEDRGVYRVVPLDDVLFFESEDGIVVVQTREGERFITDFSLKFLQTNLDGEVFFRCHRSYIVRLDAIASIAPWGAGTYRLILDRADDLGVPLARSRASDLKSLIPWSANVFD
jgi:two-component system LytT family response regulator/two-component system response regulator LytT